MNVVVATLFMDSYYSCSTGYNKGLITILWDFPFELSNEPSTLMGVQGVELQLKH